MTSEQLDFLENEFQRDPDWKLAKTRQLATELQIDRIKIYKWHYDRKKLMLANQASSD